MSRYRKPTRLGPNFLNGLFRDDLVDDVPRVSNSIGQAEKARVSNLIGQREYMLINVSNYITTCSFRLNILCS